MRVNKQIVAYFLLCTVMLWCFGDVPVALGAPASIGNENTLEILKLKSEIVQATAAIDEHVGFFMADSGETEGKRRLSRYQLCTNSEVDAKGADSITRKTVNQKVGDLRSSVLAKRVTLERMIEKLIASKALPGAGESLGMNGGESNSASQAQEASASIRKADLEESKKNLLSSIEIIQKNMIQDLESNKARLSQDKDQELAFMEMLKGNSARFPGFAFFFLQSPRDQKACKELGLYARYREAKSLGFVILPGKLDLLAKQLRKEVRVIDGKIAAINNQEADKTRVALVNQAGVGSQDSKDEANMESAR